MTNSSNNTCVRSQRSTITQTSPGLPTTYAPLILCVYNNLISPQSELSLVLLQCNSLQFWIDRPSLRISPKWTTEQQNVLFRTVDGVMLPSTRLLYTDGPPFVFGKETCFWKSLCEFFGENHMSVVLVGDNFLHIPISL